MCQMSFGVCAAEIFPLDILLGFVFVLFCCFFSQCFVAHKLRFSI